MFYERIDKDPISRADALGKAALTVRVDDELVEAVEKTDRNPSRPGEVEADGSDAQGRVAEDTAETTGDVKVAEEGDGLGTSPGAHPTSAAGCPGSGVECPAEVTGENRNLAAVVAGALDNSPPHEDRCVADGNGGDTAKGLQSSSDAQNESTRLAGSLVNGVSQPSVTAVGAGPSVTAVDEPCAAVPAVADRNPRGEEAKPSVTEVEASTKRERMPRGCRSEPSGGTSRDREALGPSVAEAAGGGGVARALVAVPSVLGSKELDAVEGMCALETEALGVESLAASRSLAVEPLP